MVTSPNPPDPAAALILRIFGHLDVSSDVWKLANVVVISNSKLATDLRDIRRQLEELIKPSQAD